MEISLRGKVAMVCGSTQGIGKAIAQEMAKAGAELVLIGRNEERLKEVVSELAQSTGINHRYLVADFSDPSGLSAVLDTFCRNAAPLHILVNNTGGPAPGPVYEAAVNHFYDAFSRHLICNQVLVQHLVPLMKKGSYGRIINIISTSVKEPIPNLGVSNTIRASVAGWSKTLATELAPFGITVNNILPGYTRTARLYSLLEQRAAISGKSKEEVEKEMLKDIPAKRFGEPEELASLALFLAGSMAGYITGVNIPVDGGKTKCF